MADATIMPVTQPVQTNQLGIDINSIISLISGLSGNKNAQGLANIADPNLPYQSGYAKDLYNFMQDPSSVLKDPAFQAAEALGAENISRQAGAAGMGASGNRLAELYNYGITSGLGYEQQRFNQLLGLTSPGQTGSAAAANLLGQGQQAQGTNLATGIAGIAPIIAQLLGLGGGAGSGLAGLIKSILGGGSSGDFSGGAGNYLTGGLSSSDINPDTGQPWLSGSDLGSGISWNLDPNQFITGSGDISNLVDVLGG